MGGERGTQRTVTLVMATIAALAFVFSFGNVWSLALRLGVPRPIAPLIAPMVDLSVLGLLAGLRYLSLRGVPSQELRGATRLMHLSGLLTLALNIADPIAAGHYGRAALDAVAPLLLLGWGTVGPQLLRHFHTLEATSTSTPTPEPTGVVAAEADSILAPEATSAVVELPQAEHLVPASDPVLAPALPVPAALLDAARTIAAQHRAETGSHITAAQLRARLGVALPLASAAHAELSG